MAQTILAQGWVAGGPTLFKASQFMLTMLPLPHKSPSPGGGPLPAQPYLLTMSGIVTPSPSNADAWVEDDFILKICPDFTGAFDYATNHLGVVIPPEQEPVFLVQQALAFAGISKFTVRMELAEVGREYQPTFDVYGFEPYFENGDKHVKNGSGMLVNFSAGVGVKDAKIAFFGGVSYQLSLAGTFSSKR